MSQSINTEYELPHPPEKVWRALTEPGLLERWLMPNDLRAVVGHKFTFKAPPMYGWDGTVHCEVLEVEPLKRLRYSWTGGPENSRLDSTVTWTLLATATGTRLSLEHAGFQPHNAMAYDAMGKGWKSKMAERIRDVLATI
jgi:uncharacterized protein YndB with AHSA1/START domain